MAPEFGGRGQVLKAERHGTGGSCLCHFIPHEVRPAKAHSSSPQDGNQNGAFLAGGLRMLEEITLIW